MGTYPGFKASYGLYPLYHKLAQRLPAEYQRKDWRVEYGVNAYKVIVSVMNHAGEVVELQDDIEDFPSDALIGQMLLVL